MLLLSIDCFKISKMNLNVYFNKVFEIENKPKLCHVFISSVKNFINMSILNNLNLTTKIV